MKPRRSESQIAACIASACPLRIWPAENALAGAVADIGVEQRGRGAAHGEDLADARKGRNDLAQRGKLLVGEAARLPAWSSLTHAIVPSMKSSGRAI